MSALAKALIHANSPSGWGSQALRWWESLRITLRVTLRPREMLARAFS